MAYTFNIGSIRCHIVRDGRHYADGGGFFGVVPRVLWERVVQPDEQNRIVSEARCLLIESSEGLILVDTGHGDKYTDKRRKILGLEVASKRDRLVADLASVGFRPEDVDIVILTHLHQDHAGGATRWDTPDHTPGQAIPTFPNARYQVQRIELADASYPNERTAATYFVDNWQPLIDANQLDIVDGPQLLAQGVHTVITPGHITALQAVWVQDGGESLLFLGDACSWAAHMNRLAWVPAWDLDPMTSIETKRALAHEAICSDALLVFQHDSQVVTGRLEMGERGPTVQPDITEIQYQYV
ncbi:MAG: MBL fold metallo-hydrolase [Chloroflexota bacterium]